MTRKDDPPDNKWEKKDDPPDYKWEERTTHLTIPDHPAGHLCAVGMEELSTGRPR